MSKDEFQKECDLKYPNLLIYSDIIRLLYSDKWFRIHSLPKSVRYPKNNNDWKILLERHNEIITELLGNNTKAFLLTGKYSGNIEFDYKNKFLESLKFIELDSIDLHKFDEEEYDQGQIYYPRFSELYWIKDKYNDLLREVAMDKIRFFLISFDKNLIIYPYDGGIDIILNDTFSRDFYKYKYKDWLPNNELGL